MLDKNDIEAKRQIEQISEFESYIVVDQLLNSLFELPKDMKIGLPEVGSHLVTPRGAYTHHGVYAGLNDSGEPTVVHYAGWSKPFQPAPVQIVSFQEFCQGKEARTQPHPYRRYNSIETIERAKSRVNENKYDLIFNNCEHFANWCIDGLSVSRQSSECTKSVTRFAAKNITKSNIYANVGTEIAHLSKSFKEFISGEISKEKFQSEVSHAAVTATSTAWYGALGQATIPIPGIGFFIGASAGYFIGNFLHQSGHIALGETPAVKEARERRERIEKMCDDLIPQIQESRRKLEAYLKRHFEGRERLFKDSFNALDNSVIDGSPEDFVNALSSINTQFGKSLQFKTFDEFDHLMKSNEVFEL